jgi:molybdate transport system substrate-binding protein
LIRRVAATAAVVLLMACGAQASTGSLSVFAAASLTDAFKALGAAFEKDHAGVNAHFNFAGSPTLVTQIEQGAKADVFASADTPNMEVLSSDGLVDGGAEVLAHNVLEIVVAPGNPKGIASLADLARPGLVYISAGPTVPAGKYALQALAKAGVAAKPKSLETDVKSVISKIELGEADAGIVYVTDVRAAGDRVQGVPIPDRYNVVATYWIARVRGAPNGDSGRAFVDYALSSSGQATLESFGFKHA